MGDKYQLAFIRQYVDELEGDFLEVGSKDYGSTQDFRSLFKHKNSDYVGLDMEEGKGVDVVVDLTLPFEAVDAKLGGKRFGTIICLSILEHCEQPFVMAENLSRLLKPGGGNCVFPHLSLGNFMVILLIIGALPMRVLRRYSLA